MYERDEVHPGLVVMSACKGSSHDPAEVLLLGSEASRHRVGPGHVAGVAATLAARVDQHELAESEWARAAGSSGSRRTTTIMDVRTSTPGMRMGAREIRVDEVEVIDSSLERRQLRLVLAWAALHREELLENWQRARAHETLKKIEFAMANPPPDITAVSVVRHGVLRLTFADGLSDEVDVLPRMWGPVSEQARTPEGFVKVAVDEETGTIAWPGHADLAPDALYERLLTATRPSSSNARKANDNRVHIRVHRPRERETYPNRARKALYRDPIATE